MKILLTLLFFVAGLSSVTFASECDYWFAQIDPDLPPVSYELDENDPKVLMKGIECFLTAQGNVKTGLLGGSGEDVSQNFQMASIEISALYRISTLYYGNEDFARAVALISDPVEVFGQFDSLKYNRKRYVSRAFSSYRAWFGKLKKIGIEEARIRKLDPLEGSGVEWY